MTTLAIRKKLATFMQVADDKKVKAVYALLEADIEQEESEYTDEFKAELAPLVAVDVNHTVGTMPGKLRRIYEDLKTAVTKDNKRAVKAEIIRGEQIWIEQYKQFINKIYF